MRKTILLVILACSVVGCGTLNNRAFRTNNLAADTGIGAVSAFNAYYRSATNGADTVKMQDLNAAKAKVYTASKKLSLSLATSEKIREDFELNAANTNRTALLITLDVVSQNVSNIVATVKELQK
jgi:hypothetical protein